MNITLELVDNTFKPITPAMALKLRDGWNTYDNLNKDQQIFLDTVAKIKYGAEETYCFHRYELNKTIPGYKGSQFYIMKCKQCEYTFSTDMKP